MHMQVGVFRKYALEFWHIPLVKRHVQMVSMLGFTFLFCTVALQPLCGALNGWHYAFFGWLCSYCVQEITQIISPR